MRTIVSLVFAALVGMEQSNAISLRAADGRVLYGDVYGRGDRGVVMLAHGGYSSRASWQPHAEQIADAGFLVLVVETRAAADLAAGKETECLYDAACQARDVTAAMAHLRTRGAKSMSLIGGSMGGASVAQAAIDAASNSIDAVVLLAPAEVKAPERIPGRKLVIVAQEDANSAGLRLPGIKAQYARMAQPKAFVQLKGSAHGQNVLDDTQGPQIIRDIIRFLAGDKP